MVNKDYINNICRKYNIQNYIINSDGSVDVNGNVYLSYRRLKKLPLNFRNVARDFYVASNQLTSLEGCPKSIGGSFCCQYNGLTSLEYFPENIHLYLHCSNNPIYSLVYSWINRLNRYSMVEYFNDLDIIRDEGKTVILDRLEDFINIFNVAINLKEVEDYYKII